MSPQAATLVYALAILGLFALDRDPKARPSVALWLPLVWLSIGGSRMVSEWLQVAPTSSVEQVLEGSPLDRNVLMGLIALGVVVLLRRGSQVRTLLLANGPLVLFFLYCGVSTLWSDYQFVSFKRWVKACGDLVMVLIVLTDPERSAAIKQLLARLGFILVPLSILLIKYYPQLGRAYDRMTGEITNNGVTTGKNLLGMVCMICGVGAVWRLLKLRQGGDGARRVGPLVAQGTLLGMAGWLFWLADSMTSLSCFVLASGLLIATSVSARARKPAVVHLMVVAVLAVSSSILFLNIGGGLLETMGRDATLTGRTGVWEVALRFAGNPLFGTGFESFWLGERLEKIWSIYWWRPNEAHNGYIEVFLNLGWVGVAFFAGVLVAGYRNVLGALRLDPHEGGLRLAFFAAVVTYNFTEAASRMFNPIWIVFLLTTMAIPEAAVRLGAIRAVKPQAFRLPASHVAPLSRRAR